MLSLSGTVTEVPAVIDVLKIGEGRVAKVVVKLGLPCEVEGGKVPPGSKKDAVCCDRLGGGGSAGMPPEAACGCMLTGFPRKLLELGPGPVSAANEAFMASTIAAIRAGSGGATATTGLETVKGVWAGEFSAEASGEGPADDSAHGRESYNEFSPSKLAAKLLLVRRAVIASENKKPTKKKPKAQTGTKTAGYCKNTLRRTANKPLRI